MSEIVAVTKEQICEANKMVTGQDYGDRYQNVSACLSSYFYYTSEKEQIASIVNLIIKNHIFPDGNKRTALAIFQYLCIENNLSYNEDNLIEKITTLASGQYSVEEASKILFG